MFKFSCKLQSCPILIIEKIHTICTALLVKVGQLAQSLSLSYVTEMTFDNIS